MAEITKKQSEILKNELIPMLVKDVTPFIEKVLTKRLTLFVDEIPTKEDESQRIAEIKAQAVEDLKDPLYKSGKADADIGDWLKDVANQIRQQAKP